MVIFLYQLGNQIPEANAYKLVLVFYSSKGPSVNVNLEFYLWGSLVPPCLIFHVIKLPNHYGLKTANATCAGASSGEFSIAMEIIIIIFYQTSFFLLVIHISLLWKLFEILHHPTHLLELVQLWQLQEFCYLKTWILYSHSLQMQPLCNCTYRWEWHVCLFSLLLHLQ